MTAPAIRPCTMGAGIHRASWPVSPRIAVTSTNVPASIDAPTSSANVTRCPSETKKMSAKTFPVSSSGIRYRSVRTRLGIIGSPYRSAIQPLVCSVREPEPTGTGRGQDDAEDREEDDRDGEPGDQRRQALPKLP